MGTGGEAGESAPASVFLTNIAEIRNRVRQNIMSGAVTPDYKGDLKLTIAILNEALATEIVCTLRYRNHFHLAEGIEAQSVAQEFLEHSNEELNHAELIAKRIRELNGEPDYNPANLLSRSHSEYQTGATLTEMLQEDLIAERIAIESYREIVRYFAPHDPTSRRMMEDILAREEEHAEEIQTLLSQTSWKSKEHLRQSFEESGEIDESESTEGRSA
ncbi:MAG: ferritin-like domain-containing protein [Oligoflexia bacterium]|nr:ferritin-like domain-containing protein [Oligoflexia bacterium]